MRNSPLFEKANEEIELTCRNFLKLFNLSGSPATNISILYKIQNTLLKVQTNNAGRLRSSSRSIKNYLSIQVWCSLFNIEENNIGHKLVDANKLSHIMGFGTLLGDGELADHLLDVADCIHTGASPSEYDELMNLEISRATTGWIKNDTRINLKKKMLQCWEDIRELVMMKFKGIHKICSVISKKKEANFKKTYKLSRKGLMISTREELKKKKRKFSDIDDDDDVLELCSQKNKKLRCKFQVSKICCKPKI